MEEANAWTTTVVGHIASSNRLLSGDVFMVGASFTVLECQADDVRDVCDGWARLGGCQTKLQTASTLSDEAIVDTKR